MVDALGALLISGPNWIHGTLFNPLMPLAKISCTQLTFPNEASQTVFTSSGEPLSPETSRFLYETVWKYADEAIEYSAVAGESIPPEWSMYDFCLARITADDRLSLEYKLIALQMVELLTEFTAVDIRKQSLRHYQVEAELSVSSFSGKVDHRETVHLWHRLMSRYCESSRVHATRLKSSLSRRP